MSGKLATFGSGEPKFAMFFTRSNRSRHHRPIVSIRPIADIRQGGPLLLNNTEAERNRISVAIEIKDEGSEFHWSRPRMVALVFAAATTPIFLIFEALGYQRAGGIAWLAAYIGLTIGYVRPTRLRSFMQWLIPTTAEKAERARKG